MLIENLRIAFAALRANLMRSILTTLGIIIGSAAVIAVVSIVQGLQHTITLQLQGVGATHMMVLPRQDANQGPGVINRQVKLTWEDMRAIDEQVAGIRAISPIIIGGGQAKYRDRQHTPNFVAGASEDYPEVFNHTVDEGRFFGRFDVERRRKVAVIGRELITELDLGNEPIGKEIYVGNIPVTVVGVLEERGQSLGTDLDDVVVVPFRTALSLFGNAAGEQIQIRLQAADTELVPRIEDDITTLLRRRHKLGEDEEDDFDVVLQDELLDTIGSVLGSVTAVVGAVVGVALLVGGIGIMNIMLVSVTERTREIGVRKSVGARKQDILLQFLIEALTLSLIGGVIGLGVGWGIGALVASLLPGDWPPAYVPMWAVALSFGFCSAVGMIFGIYPASKAARLDPIEALRYE
ncbi:MAG: ABC transporter permease [Acidobacteriota bacterium]